jgi:hypothetical protein
MTARNLSPRRHFDAFRLPGDAFLQTVGAQIGGEPDLACGGLHELRHRTDGGAQLFMGLSERCRVCEYA